MKSKGVIKTVLKEKGSGFIQSEDGREFFFHRSHLENLDFERIKAGDPVEFEFDEFRGQTTPKAMVAQIVRKGRGSGE